MRLRWWRKICNAAYLPRAFRSELRLGERALAADLGFDGGEDVRYRTGVLHVGLAELPPSDNPKVAGPVPHDCEARVRPKDDPGRAGGRPRPARKGAILAGRLDFLVTRQHTVVWPASGTNPTNPATLWPRLRS